MLNKPDAAEASQAFDLLNDAAEWARLTELAIWGLQSQSENTVVSQDYFEAAALASHHTLDTIETLERVLEDMPRGLRVKPLREPREA